ncbi:MAG: hypothetical protein Q8J63_08220 [Candidatus Aquicultor sp.]|nr:hypothetical protein [Candidatus Aquicultor sp.]
MKKALVILMAVAMVFAFASMALATVGDIEPTTYDISGKDWSEYSQGATTGNVYNGETASTHLRGTWNSPYTTGVDGYNYNDAQDYTKDGDQVNINGKMVFQSGPHGGYLTSTHRCRECHAVHRAAGQFKLLRSDTRFEACDWCHGTGAGSGFNIQMDNNDDFTTEYNVGHTMGFGIDSGKWKAPDDTYPAFTPNYWQGGFSCFDCHSPHANPARMLGYNSQGQPYPALVATDTVTGAVKVYNIVNSGHDMMGLGGKNYAPTGAQSPDNYPIPAPKPIYLAGSWLLIKNPDREIATTTETVNYYKVGDLGTGDWQTGSIATATIPAGVEISDMIFAKEQAGTMYGVLNQFDSGVKYPVNKLPIDWDTPIGTANLWDEQFGAGMPPANTAYGTTVRNPYCQSFVLDEFCTDCHDGNAGLHTIQAPLFSEDRALRSGTDTPSTADYDLAYGHDVNSRHCGRQMRFNPEDGLLGGPRCRNCHKGSSACGVCHSSGKVGTTDNAMAADNSRSMITDTFGQMGFLGGSYGGEYAPKSTYLMTSTSDGQANEIAVGFNNPDNNMAYAFKKSRTVTWGVDWRQSATDFGEPGKASAIASGGSCSDDGFSWPHRTLGWKMLKDDLFGLNFNGDPIGVGETRTAASGYFDRDMFTTFPVSIAADSKAHDLDSVCLDCHNPTVWNATSGSDHVDDPANPNDNHDDELLTRGLP